MIAAVVGLLSATAIGVPVALAIHPRLPLRTAVGAGILLGIAIASTGLLFLSVIGVSWSLLALSLVAIPVAALGFIMMLRQTRSFEGARRSLIAIPIEFLAYLPIVGYGRWAAASPVNQGDFWSIWGLKARLFWENRGIDWDFLLETGNSFAHLDYPPLFPLALDYLTLVRGDWTETVVSVFYVALAIALLLIVRDCAFRHFGSPIGSALLILVISNLTVTKWVGLAENVILALATASILLLRNALHSDDGRLMTLAAILLGLAALTKNEGQALVLAAFIGFVIYDRFSFRRVWRLWPAAVLAALWPIVRPRGIAVDLTEGDFWGRAVERLTNPSLWKPSLDFLIPYQERIWIGTLIAIVAAGVTFIRRERFVLTTLLLQIMFCLSAYLVTPRDLKWHIATSWQRVTAQLALLVAFVGLIAAADAVVRLLESRATPPEVSPVEG